MVRRTRGPYWSVRVRKCSQECERGRERRLPRKGRPGKVVSGGLMGKRGEEGLGNLVGLAGV
jgi:hypothetical protein